MTRLKHKKPELLAPAGDWCSLRTAVENGADSVYFGVRGVNMRNLARNFDMLELKKVMDFLHEHGKKGYLALNIIIYDSELAKIGKILRQAKKCGVDAVILWDMAAFSLARDEGLSLHLSTQAGVANAGAVRFYSGLGADRIILARECRLQDIRNIIAVCRKTRVRCEIEAFIHGAMCVSISGRCFLSGHSFSRSANRGKCLQPCRREYMIMDTQHDARYVLGKDYLLSPKDLCTIDFIDEMIDAGIHSFKIEGRMRSPEYVRTVTSVYRAAIDSFFEGTLDDARKRKFKRELRTVYNRGFSRGFYFGVPRNARSRALGATHEKIYIGEVVRFFRKIGVAEVVIRKERLCKGDTVLCSGAKTPAVIADITDMEINHQKVDSVEKGFRAGVKFPASLRPGDKLFLWKKKTAPSLRRR